MPFLKRSASSARFLRLSTRSWRNCSTKARNRTTSKETFKSSPRLKNSGEPKAICNRGYVRADSNHVSQAHSPLGALRSKREATFRGSDSRSLRFRPISSSSPSPFHARPPLPSEASLLCSSSSSPSSSSSSSSSSLLSISSSLTNCLGFGTGGWARAPEATAPACFVRGGGAKTGPRLASCVLNISWLEVFKERRINANSSSAESSLPAPEGSGVPSTPGTGTLRTGLLPGPVPSAGRWGPFPARLVGGTTGAGSRGRDAGGAGAAPVSSCPLPAGSSALLSSRSCRNFSKTPCT
mmetsp:Transcript_78503/g.173885  ORF Transcript_78503/g.173885 Transcript_78503/m.173885 type:complete len:296 (-) Transcript_78503:299-1186(-)